MTSSQLFVFLRWTYTFELTMIDGSTAAENCRIVKPIPVFTIIQPKTKTFFLLYTSNPMYNYNPKQSFCIEHCISAVACIRYMPFSGGGNVLKRSVYIYIWMGLTNKKLTLVDNLPLFFVR